jgi:hypothetical protein
MNFCFKPPIWLLSVAIGFVLSVGPKPVEAQSDANNNAQAPQANTELASPDAQKPEQEPTQGQGGSIPPEDEPQSYLDIYGFVMLDMGYDVNTIDPNWFDVERPSKLPSFPGEFGKNGNTYFSVRQSRFGVRGEQYTAIGKLKYEFEFDMFGVGVDAGQTTIRPRQYWGEIGPILAGQTNSVFMDGDIFPNVIEYWGPNGMVFLRNPQLRYTPLNGPTTLMFALEKPGASGDAGVIADRIDLTNIHARFQYPDLTGAISHTWENKSYFRVSGIVRDFKIDNVATNATQNIVGWGVSAGSNVRFHNNILRLQYTYGEGIENYMNDAPIDVAPEFDPTSLIQPIKGKAIPMYGLVAYVDHNWSEKWCSALGYSRLVMDNTNLQTPDAFHAGEYASTNLLYSPFKNFMAGGEFQYGRRFNMSSGFNPHDYRIQFSFKYSFDYRVLGKKPS